MPFISALVDRKQYCPATSDDEVNGLKTMLGAKFRRLRSRLGAPKAITAMAHTLVDLFIACSSSATTTCITESSIAKPNTGSSNHIGRLSRRQPSTCNSFHSQRSKVEFLESCSCGRVTGVLRKGWRNIRRFRTRKKVDPLYFGETQYASPSCSSDYA